jgi:hypothetical protein
MMINTIKNWMRETCLRRRRSRGVPREGRNGLALISAVFVTLFVSSVTLSLSSMLSNSSSGSVEDLQAQQAAYIVDGGMHYILTKSFRDSTDFTTIPTESNVALGSGTFSVTYSNRTASAADITVTSLVQNSAASIQQHVVKLYGTGSAISGADIDLSSSQNGGGSITGPTTYTSSFSGETDYVLSPAAAPGTDPGTVSLATLTAMTTSTVNGNYTVPNGFNGYVHVTGDVTISGTITMTGLIVADGNITLDANKKNITMTGTLAAGGNILTDFKNGAIVNLTAAAIGGQMPPLLLAVGNINFKQFQDSASTFKGLIRAGGNVTIELKQQDTLNVLGAIIANGDLTVDSKQNSSVGVNFGSGSSYLPSSLILSSWKKN